MDAGSLHLFLLASSQILASLQRFAQVSPHSKKPSLKSASPKYLLPSASPTCLVLLAWLGREEPKLWSQGGLSPRPGSAI